MCRRCRTQYSGSVASAFVIQVPLRFEMNGSLGARSGSAFRYARNGSRIPSSIRLWAAMSMLIRWAWMSCLASFAWNAASGSFGPDTTHSPGLLMQARSRWGSPASSGSSCSRAMGTLSIPPAGTVSNRVPRRCTSPTPCS